MDRIQNSLIIFDLLNKKIERDQFLIEYSVGATKKYGKRCEGLVTFNEDLKQSLFLKQIVDTCSFLDEFNAFRSFAKDNEKVRGVCRKVKPAIDRIKEVRGLRHYRNALAAHNYRHDKEKESVVLLSDYTKSPDYPNSTAELFFLSTLCTTIIEAINVEFENELHIAKCSYWERLDDDENDPLRGIKSLREAYDEVDKYRMKLGLNPKFLVGEFEEFNIALKKLKWENIPKEFDLSEDGTSSLWCEVLDMHLRMRGYTDIAYLQGNKGRYRVNFLELYGYTVTVIDRVYINNPDDIYNEYDFVSSWEPSNTEDRVRSLQGVYEEIMKVVTP